ncbi:HD domain-containing protein [Metabacillus arenae]|uniref:Bifunctional (P)ppGpp synthetase/guanosine-3',5'-bis(Diphosphate) 3'-pyrophosphohydrolase n=1 Tax=Metabacillus arenae TaxID=2771434 RepID=A0A926NBL7_9BACI|nr:HD domain-containing protein [Metabacillus arenae]MBD1381262.1 bifunctional (p)ppGpp synthetase/guanosine-3',5'-bis(diphosphate) 3'-pyrophosphohydrolase [Metabacillus arenae]
MNLIDKAKRFAEIAHSGQERKLSGEPYFQHLENVALILLKAGFREEVIAAGYLHDAVEDTDTEISHIEKKFGIEVAQLVTANTENKNLSWEERKQRTISFVKTASIEEKAIIAADKLDNINSLEEFYKRHGDSIWSYFNRGRDKQAEYYKAVSENLFYHLDPNQIPSYFYSLQRSVKELFG